MQLNLTGHHVDITDSLRDYVGSKLTRLERHFDRLTKVHCILTVEKLRQQAEATIRLAGATVHATAVHDDMYAAIDPRRATRRLPAHAGVGRAEARQALLGAGPPTLRALPAAAAREPFPPAGDERDPRP